MRESLTLLGTYLGIVVVLQAGAFVLSQLISMVAPAASLMVFLVLFAAVFALAWPIAVRVNFRLIPETPEERAVRLGRHAVSPPSASAYERGRTLAEERA